MKLKINRKSCTVSYGDTCKEACEEQIDLVCSLYGEEFEVTDDLIVDAASKGVRVDWFLDFFDYSFTGKLALPRGRYEWYKNGELHREDGPAVKRADGTKEWYREGRLHREDGPAIEWVDGTKEWFRKGKLHRKDGPAIEYANGTRKWYRNEKLHRENGPAIEQADGTKEWYRNGRPCGDEETA